jgi:glucose/arabinose dehydrogenase
VVVSGGNNGPWTGASFHDGALFIAEGGELEGGRILRLEPDGSLTALVENLPSVGDHHTNGIVAGPDGWLYFGQGTATNSAVVGPDNADFGWLARHPDFHDVPCRDVMLRGRNYESADPLSTGGDDPVTTGAFSAFGTATEPGQVIAGETPCNGAILRLRPEGGRPEMVAWGFRNPFGLAFAPDGQLYVTDNSYDRRGSRPVFGAGDALHRVRAGVWYGWPDFHGATPLSTGDRYAGPGDAAPEPVLAEHPNEPPRPVALLGVHSSSSGIDFSRSQRFGHAGEAFVAQFGDMAPGVGKVLAPVGFRVVTVDVGTGVITDFAANRESGPASLTGGGGLERPVSVRFDPAGEALYVVDFGVMTVSEQGASPVPETGVLWRITRAGPA